MDVSSLSLAHRFLKSAVVSNALISIMEFYTIRKQCDNVIPVFSSENLIRLASITISINIQWLKL